jgi:uncharacterized protein YqgV (UPF0045/DUF77 family)
MQCSIEISLYPLRDDYLRPIDAFIEALGGVDGIECEVGPMSTRIHGDYDRVMAVVTEAMRQSLEQDRGAFVMKVLGIDAREPHGRPG